MAGKIYLSFQKINVYSRCGLQYYFKYVEGIPLPPTSAVAMGRAVHKSIEKYYLDKKERGEDPELDLLLSTYTDEIENIFASEDVFLEGEEATKGKTKIKDELKNTGVQGLKTYHRGRAVEIVPFLVEEEFQIELAPVAEKLGFKGEDYENVILTGYIDLVDAEGNIIDHKIRKNHPPKDEADKSQQLTVYAIGYNYLLGELPKAVKLDNIIVTPNGGAKLTTLTSHRSEEDIKRLLMRTLRIVDGIRKGVFIPPDHTSWACTYCLYKKLGHCKEYIS